MTGRGLDGRELRGRDALAKTCDALASMAQRGGAAAAADAGGAAADAGAAAGGGTGVGGSSSMGRTDALSAAEVEEAGALVASMVAGVLTCGWGSGTADNGAPRRMIVL